MRCSSVQEVIFLYTDNELDEEVCISVRRHLELCPECAREIAYTARLLELLRQRCKRATAPRRLRQRILTSLPHRQNQALD
jgi:mycothiol system anti-sigma-R factor